MSAHGEYRCDGCATAGAGRFQRYGFGVNSPKGWHLWDDKHFCSYPCLIKHLQEMEGRARAARALHLDSDESS